MRILNSLVLVGGPLAACHLNSGNNRVGVNALTASSSSAAQRSRFEAHPRPTRGLRGPSTAANRERALIDNVVNNTDLPTNETKTPEAQSNATTYQCAEDLAPACIDECIDMLKSCEPTSDCNISSFNQDSEAAETMLVDCNFNQWQRCQLDYQNYRHCELVADIQDRIDDPNNPIAEPTQPTTGPTESEDSVQEGEPLPLQSSIASGLFLAGLISIACLAIRRFCAERSEVQGPPSPGDQASWAGHDPERALRHERRDQLARIKPWVRMDSVSSDAPKAESACPISLEDYEDQQEPVRIRQPNKTFTNKVFELSALTTYMHQQVDHREGFLDPTNRIPFTVEDICREKKNQSSSSADSVARTIGESDQNRAESLAIDI